jgi:hypothetical protein
MQIGGKGIENLFMNRILEKKLNTHFHATLLGHR